jgi:hypothetical protein
MQKKEQNTLTGQAAETQIVKWKNQFGEIFTATVDNHIAYFKKPTRQQLAYAMMLQNNMLKQTETLLKSCFVGGSEAILTEADYFLSAVDLYKKLTAVKKVELGKL